MEHEPQYQINININVNVALGLNGSTVIQNSECDESQVKSQASANEMPQDFRELLRELCLLAADSKRAQRVDGRP